MPVISVCSPKGGVGKTTLAANLAHVFSASGARVVCIDFDPQNSLRLYFGVQLSEERGFINIFTEDPKSGWIDAVINGGKNLFVIPYGKSSEDQRRALASVLADDKGPTSYLGEWQKGLFCDPSVLLIADFPPGYSPALAAISTVADISIVPLMADASSVSLFSVLENNELIDRPLNERLGYYIVLNHVDNRIRLTREVQDFAHGNVADRLLGVIHSDTSVIEAAAMQRSISDFNQNSSAAFDIEVIARKIAGLLKFDVKSGTMVLNPESQGA